MQLFSQKKAIIAASLSALVALGACGDNVTVPVAPAAQESIVMTPPSQNMNVGERVNFSVNITGGSTTTPPTLATCASSNTAVASVALTGSQCVVTAVAAGNATITATSSTGKQAGSSVTVAAPAPAIGGIVLTPAAANVPVNGTVTINANPSTSGTGVTLARTYATSSAAIATVSAAGVVTGVAPGQATITVTLTGSGTGLTTTTVTGAVVITVTALPPGVTAVNVTPQTISLVAGLTPAATQAITATAAQPSGATAATFTYGTTNPAVATVSATGVVTAVGVGTASITVTATSAASANFSASTATAVVPVTVGAVAQVIINSLTDQGATIDITNVAGQFEVNLSLQPNGQTVSSVQAFVCDAAETATACIARGPAAQQTFGAAGGQAGPIQLYINSAEFTPPNFGVDTLANTLYKNGLKTIIATVTTTTISPSATNNLSQINFNNIDGWTIRWTQPTNRANDANGITWYGGPSTPDPLTPNATSGTGSFAVVPVIYTPNRWIVTAVLNFAADAANGATFACGANIITGRNLAATAQTPLGIATYGTNARSATTAPLNFNCGSDYPAGVQGAVSNTNGYVPIVVSSTDNNNNAGPTTAGIQPQASTSIFTPISASSIGNPTFVGRYRSSLSYRPTTIFIPGDYQSPVVTAYDLRGTGGTGIYVDSGWVNAPYSLAGGFSTATGNPLRLSVTDAVNSTFPGVGLLGAGTTTSARNTRFNACLTPTFSSSAPTNCTSPIAVYSIAQTIGSTPVAGTALPEATDLTNAAYYVQVVETDRLGNRGQSNPASWAATDGSGRALAATPNFSGVTTSASFRSPQNFGVDLTQPALVTLPNSPTATGTNPFFPNFVRTDADSIYSSAGNTYGTTNNANAVFAVRFNDSRSGFSTCTQNVSATADNCGTFANSGQVAAGTFSIVRRSASAAVSVTNDAVVDTIIRTSNTSATAANRRLNVMNSVVAAGDPANREFSINIFGAANRVSGAVTLVGPTPNANVAGYYTFSGTLVDRAGNTTVITPRSVAIDNTTPQITGITVPAVLAGATSVTFGPSGTDDLEAITGELALNYPQLSASGLVSLSQPVGIRFRRVPSFSSTALLGLWHNPFASLTDNKLATPVGPGTTLSNAGLTIPIPFIQQIQTVNSGDAPLNQTDLAPAAMKPNLVTAWLHDIRSTLTPSGTTGSLAAASIFGGSQPSISVAQSSPLFDGQITQPATAKNWTENGTAVVAANTNTPTGIRRWFAFDVTTPTSVEFRVETNTSVTNPPFTSVSVIRANVGTWDYLGQATFIGTLDQGGLRYFRYTFSFASISQGLTTLAALSNGDVLRAIGVDVAGNGLSTNNATVANQNAVTSVTISPVGPIFVPSSGGSYQLTTTLVQPSGAVPVPVTYAVSFGPTVGAGAISVSPAGIVTIAPGFSAGQTWSITASATGISSTGFTNNTVTATVQFVSGVAGVNSVSLAGTIPSTLNPGTSFTLTATASQPTSQPAPPAPTYNWTIPAGFSGPTTTSTPTATFTYIGNQSLFNAPVTFSVTASTPNQAPGYTASTTAPATVTNASVNGFWNTDTPFSLALSIVGQSINAGGTNQLTLTSGSVAGTTLLPNVCTATNTSTGLTLSSAIASVSPTGLITVASTNPNSSFTTAVNATFSCVQSRATQVVAGVNYFQRSVTSNSVTALLLPFGLQDVVLSPTSPGTLLIGQTFGITATPTTATGAGAITWSATSSAPGTATVTISSSGVATVTGVAAGAATITITATVPATASTTAGNTITRTYVVNVQ